MQDYEESIAQLRDAEQNNEKPAIRGYDEAATERIGELLRSVSDAVRMPIDRFRIECAKFWALELKEQLDLLDTMMIYE